MPARPRDGTLRPTLNHPLGPTPTAARDVPGLPLHARIREDIASQIARGALTARQRLASEADLMRQYSVSRLTVRHALQALQQQGMIVKVPGKGSYVAAIFHSPPWGGTAMLPADRPPGQSRVRLLQDAWGPADATVAHEMGVAPGCLVRHWRRLRLRQGHSPVLELAWLADHMMARRFDACRDDPGTASADVHVDAQTADPHTAVLLGVEPGSALLMVEHRWRDAADRVVAVERRIRPGGQMPFQVKLQPGAGWAV